jgi:hypothetical protein
MDGGGGAIMVRAMNLIGLDRIQNLLTQPGFSFKIVLNETAAIFLRSEDQHRDFKVEGVSYEDDYAGNALERRRPYSARGKQPH